TTAFSLSPLGRGKSPNHRSEARRSLGLTPGTAARENCPMSGPLLRRYVLPAAAVVLALGLVGGEVGRRDRVKREEAAADWAYYEYRALVSQEWEVWRRGRVSTVEYEELTDLANNAAQ